jgi:hypothetical protein
MIFTIIFLAVVLVLAVAFGADPIFSVLSAGAGVYIGSKALK